MQEIRHSALEVLFDTLKYHGGTFAESFWKRIFDSVLLPIFDHVRAEVRACNTVMFCLCSDQAAGRQSDTDQSELVSNNSCLHLVYKS